MSGLDLHEADEKVSAQGGIENDIRVQARDLADRIRAQHEERHRDALGRHVRDQIGLITEEELAAALDVKTGTLAQWRSRDYGPSWTKLGSHVFYRLDSLELWTLEHEHHLVDIEGDEHNCAIVEDQE